MFVPLVFRILDFNSQEIETNFDNVVNLLILFIDPFISGSLTVISISLKQKHGITVIKNMDTIDKLFRKLGMEISFYIPRIAFTMFVVVSVFGYSAWTTFLSLAGFSVIDEIMERFCYMICYVQLTVVLCYYIGCLLCVYLR